MEEDTEYLKLPIEDRCQHKLWKARVSGYEAATKLFQTIDDEKSPEWNKYQVLVKKFAVDSNAVAQEKGLDALLAFVENAGNAGRTSGEVMNGLVTKCLGAPKAKTKEKAINIIMMYIEIEKQEIVLEELIKGLANKTPKVVTACIQCMREALRDFGMKVISIKALVKLLATLLEDRDKGVRDEGKLLAVEIYRWIGAALKPQLSSLKPVQVTELEAEFVKLAGEKAVPVRYLRSQQAAKAQQSSSASTPVEDETASPVSEEIDAFELMEAVDILSKIPKDFYDKIDAKKWQERKEAVDAVIALLSAAPKLEAGDYFELVKALRKIITKDTNVVVITLAGKALAQLALGLRKKFQQYAGQCVPGILEKFKEKKQTVVQALREAIDAIFLSTTLDAISEDVVSALDNKNPSVKAETASFLARCFSKSSITSLNKKLLKLYSTVLIKCLNDPDATVRDAAAEAIGTAMKVVTEKNITPFIAEVDSLKMAKIKEFCEKAEVVATSTARATAGDSKPAAKTVVKSSSLEEAAIPTKTAESKQPAARRPATAPSGRPAASKTAAGATRPKKASSASTQQQQEVTEKELSPEEVDEKAAALLPGEVISGLGDSNWKTRLAAMEQFTEVVKGMSKEDIPAQVIVRTLSKKPGFKDTNFQVMKLKFELISWLVANSQFTRRSASYCINDLAEKIADVKNGSAASEALTGIAEATKLDWVSLQIMDFAFNQKNPKNQSEAMNWLGNAIKEFGFSIQVKPIIEYTKKALAATNPGVRTAAIGLLGVMYLYMGASLRVLFENEKTALLQQIDAEFVKLQGIQPPAATRGLAPASTMRSTGSGDEGDEEGSNQAINVADLIPRTDISGQLTATLLTEMSDKNWKVRGEALQKLVAIINEAKFITGNLGDLPAVLRARMADSNKNLAMISMTICQSLGTAMGPHSSKYIKSMIPAMFASLGDNKVQVRQSAISCMNVWVEQSGVTPVLEGELISDTLKLENPLMRTELLGWLAEKLTAAKSVSPDLALCVPQLYAAVEDRNADVRKKAQDALLPFMIHLGYESMNRAASKLKPASKNTVAPLLEKVRPNLPAKPAAPAKNKPASAPVASAPPRDEPLDDEGKVAAGNKVRNNRAASKTRVTSGKKKEEEGETSPVMVANNLKDQRISDEQKLKVLKWNFTTPRDEFYELLKEQMITAGFNQTIRTNMFHNDFKFHIKAIDALSESLDASLEATVANLDLILKWFALRFFDTNPSVILKGLEYLQSMFTLLIQADYRLQDIEANSFIPYLITKLGDPKDSVRQATHTIARQICRVYPASKMFLFVMDGLKSKNARQRTECMEELGYLIDAFGITVCQPNPQTALKEVAKQIADRDNNVRNAALNCLVQAYYKEGEKVYKYVGPISDKDMSLLEERIKRSSKPKGATVVVPPKTSPPGPPKVLTKGAFQQVAAPPPEETPALKRLSRPPASAPNMRPVSGMFSLDLDRIEQMVDERNGVPSVAIPKLVEHDLADILDDTIRLPETKLRPSSPSMKVLNAASAAIDLVISRIHSADIATSIEALAQIEEFMKDPERAEALESRVDQLLVVISAQFHMTYTRHVGDDVTNRDDVLNLYRSLVNTQLAFLEHRKLAKAGSKDVLRDLLYHVITSLLDVRLNELTEGPSLVRSFNVVVVKLIDKCHYTSMMSALIRLLYDCIGNEATPQKFTELVMKCIWKMIRITPNIYREADVHVAKILQEIHAFLRAYPLSSWKQRQSDIPLRTLKTIIHTLIKFEGAKVLDYLSEVEGAKGSELELSIQKLLKGGSNKQKSGSNHSPGLDGVGANQANDGRSPTRKEGKHSRRMSKHNHEHLADIFKRIGSQEHTKEGLVALYEFKKRYPEADIEPFLHKSSRFFQDYLRQGLMAVEQEREGKICSPGIKLSHNISSHSFCTTGSMPNLNTTTDTADPAMLLERLKELRSRCGMDNSEYDAWEFKGTDMNRITPNIRIEPRKLSAMDHTATENHPPPTLSPPASSIPRSESSDGVGSLGTAANDVDELRKRLERIKNSSKT